MKDIPNGGIVTGDYRVHCCSCLGWPVMPEFLKPGLGKTGTRKTITIVVHTGTAYSAEDLKRHIKEAMDGRGY